MLLILKAIKEISIAEIKAKIEFKNKGKSVSAVKLDMPPIKEAIKSLKAFASTLKNRFKAKSKK